LLQKYDKMEQSFIENVEDEKHIYIYIWNHWCYSANYHYYLVYCKINILVFNEFFFLEKTTKKLQSFHDYGTTDRASLCPAHPKQVARLLHDLSATLLTLLRHTTHTLLGYNVVPIPHSLTPKPHIHTPKPHNHAPTPYKPAPITHNHTSKPHIQTPRSRTYALQTRTNTTQLQFFTTQPHL